MAAEKKNIRKSKKTNSSRSSGSTKKTTARSASDSKRSHAAPRKSTKKVSNEQALYYIKRSRFIRGIILLALSFLCILFFFMTGEKVWKSLHECYWGLFGFMGFMVPVILSYCSFQMFKEQSTYRFPLKVFFFTGTVILFSTVIYAFSSSGMELKDYGTELMNCFTNGFTYGGTGFIGGILGIPLAKIFGSVAGGIIAFLIFLFFLYMSFEALFMNLIDRIKEPVSDRLNEHKEIREKVREEKNKLRAETRQKAHEEYVTRKVDQKLNAVKKKSEVNNTFTRIDKSPIYEPEHSIQHTGKPLSLSKNLADSSSSVPATKGTGIDGVVPDVMPNKAKNTAQSEQIPSMEHIGGESGVSTDVMDIALLIKKDNKKTEPIKDKYDDTLQTVFGSKKETSDLAKPLNIAKGLSSERHSEQSPSSALQSSKASSGDDMKLKPTPAPELIAGGYIKPPFTLLEPQPDEYGGNVSEELHTSANKLVDTLKSFGVQTTIMNISRGPSVTRYELQPASGVKISKITNLADDIAMNLAATGVRIEAPIPGKNAVGIEVPNKNVSVVKMRSLVESSEFQNAKSKLTVALGKDITGHITLADLSKMPHLLIAGSTGSGKSVCINSMLVSLLYKANPDEVKLMLIDPKVVELGVYNGIPHLLVPVVTDPRKAAGALNWAVTEMLDRYKTFAEYNVRDMHSYNRLVDKQNAETEDTVYPEDTERSFEEDEMLAQAQAELKQSDDPPKKNTKLEKMSQIVIVIDELADLMMAAPNEVEESICRLAQMARAAGMHLVIATQRPSVDVITGLIKANVPSRIAFAVKSQIDSRTILDSGGAEKLLGKGDMLFSPIGTTKPVRVQGCFVNDEEIESIVSFIKENKVVEYDKRVIEEIENSAIPEKDAKVSDTNDDNNTDPMMEQAIQCVVEAGQASTSLLQRRLRLGYARAGRLIDEMEQMGIVGPHEGSKPRQVLMSYQQWLERNMSQNE